MTDETANSLHGANQSQTIRQVRQRRSGLAASGESTSDIEAARPLIARLQALRDRRAGWEHYWSGDHLMLEAHRVVGDLVAVNGDVYVEPLIAELQEAIASAPRLGGRPMKTASPDLPKD